MSGEHGTEVKITHLTCPGDIEFLGYGRCIEISGDTLLEISNNPIV
jgi:hypothetical protein